MRIPATKVVNLLTPGTTVEVRTSDYRGMDRAMRYTDAVALAVRGEVEGIASPSGRIRYLRVLPESERPIPVPVVETRRDTGRGGIIARTNLGVFRQAVREVIVRETVHGERVAVASGDIVGHVWTHCSLRGVA